MALVAALAATHHSSKQPSAIPQIHPPGITLTTAEAEFCNIAQAAEIAEAPATKADPGAVDSMDRSTALSLSNIRDTLIRLEDTIIFTLIERAQFAYNAPVYQSGTHSHTTWHSPP